MPQGPHGFLNLNTDGTPVRWNPCQPIHYQVNLANAPTSAVADVQEAVRRVQAATGITWIYDGPTVRTADQQIGSVFQQTSSAAESRWLPVLVSWVSHDHFHFITGDSRAIAFGDPNEGDGNLSNEYVSGAIVIDASQELPPGFGSRYDLGPVLLHELGHIMGLAHVPDNSQIMWSSLLLGADQQADFSVTGYGSGDLEGLRLEGRTEGCLQSRG